MRLVQIYGVFMAWAAGVMGCWCEYFVAIVCLYHTMGPIMFSGDVKKAPKSVNKLSPDGLTNLQIFHVLTKYFQ